MTKLQAILRKQQRQRRNALPVFQALAVVAAILAVVCFAFKYHYRSPNNNQQNTVLSVIHTENNGAFFRELDLRDPYRIYDFDYRESGMRPEGERRAAFVVPVEKPDELPMPSPHRDRPLEVQPFPVSPRWGVTPAAKAPEKTLRPATVVISPQGEILRLPALNALKSPAAPGADSVINIYRNGTGTRFRVMRSCGVGALDAAAGRELTRRGDLEGVYTVVWHHKEVKK